jgi:hypothetical protein
MTMQATNWNYPANSAEKQWLLYDPCELTQEI